MAGKQVFTPVTRHRRRLTLNMTLLYRAWAFITDGQPWQGKFRRRAEYRHTQIDEFNRQLQAVAITLLMGLVKCLGERRQ